MRANRLKNEFIAMPGHELRNPLAAIHNAAHILLRGKFDDEKLTWASNVVHRQVLHLVEVVNDLLDVSRIVQGKLTLKKAAVNLGGAIDLAVETSKPQIEERRHELILNVPTMPLHISGDSRSLRSSPTS